MLIIFDCDGVLVDTETTSARVLSECLQGAGVALGELEVFRRFRGKSIADCARLVATLLRSHEPYRSMSESRLEQCGQQFWHKVQGETLRAFAAGVQPIAGIEAVLQTLRGRGVASNGKHEKMRATLGAAGLLGFFPEHRFSAEDVSVGKPAPDLFLHAAQTLKVPAGECVVVEDSPTGARAARAAGMGLIGYCPPGPDKALAEQTAGQMREQGARIIHSMDELPGQM